MYERFARHVERSIASTRAATISNSRWKIAEMTYQTEQSNRVGNASRNGPVETLRIFRERIPVFPGKFEFEGETYRSLSAVAQAVTGSHWNGRLFFGLTGKGES